MVRILYFAALVDRLGTAAEDIELADDVMTVRDLPAQLRTRGGAWSEALGAGMVRITVNKQFVELDAAVKNGDEVALISATL